MKDFYIGLKIVMGVLTGIAIFPAIVFILTMCFMIVFNFIQGFF